MHPLKGTGRLGREQLQPTRTGKSHQCFSVAASLSPAVCDGQLWLWSVWFCYLVCLWQIKDPSAAWRRVLASCLGKPGSGTEKTIATSSLKTGFNLTNLLLVSAFAPWESLHSPKPSSTSFQSQAVFFSCFWARANEAILVWLLERSSKTPFERF